MQTTSQVRPPACPAAPPTCPVEAYARAVLAGEIVAGKLVRLACERHLRDLEHGHERGLRWDPAAAMHAIAFFGFLRHSKGRWAGEPLVLSPWQMFIVGSLFGWRRADGSRRFRTAYCELARKNGKSTLAAGIGLYLLVADGEAGAEVYSAATTKAQARIVHSEAMRMVRKSPLLKKRVKLFKDNLNVEATDSKYEPLASESDKLDGLNVHGAIVDELHAHPSRGLLDILETATGARKQPLLFLITTAGFDRTSCCRQEHDLGVRVLERAFTSEADGDSYFAFIATIDEGDDWSNPACWGKANPNLGVSVSVEGLREKCEKAKQVPAYQATFLRLHLDVWTESSVRAIDPIRWARCKQSFPDLRGQVCYAGLDLGSTSDLTSLGLIWPIEDRIFCRAYCWCPREAAEARERRDRALYLSWGNQGHLELTEGETIDYKFVRRRVVELHEEFSFRVLAGDRNFQGEQLLRELRDDEGLNVVAFGQGFFSMGPPTKRFIELVTSGKLVHEGNPLTDWTAGNLCLEQDAAGSLKPSKRKSREKIDPMVAIIMALGQYMAIGETQGSEPRVAYL